MKIHNQVEPQVAFADRPAGSAADTAARRPQYHPAAVPRVGRVLRGRYRLESLLGMGAMGEVYRAIDLRLQQPCAVKLVFPGAVFGLKAHRRFVNEARVVARLFHPNIVEVRDFNEDEDGTKFLVMELLEGQDLHELLSRQGRLPLPRAMEIVRAVGAALQYAHDLGIVHRDVKPENIFLVSRGRSRGAEAGEGERELVKVLDFGLAKLTADPASEEPGRDEAGSTAAAQLTKGIIIGTMAYLSPEATGMDSRLVDARSDQWSLAVVAYQLLSGRLPFGNPNPLGLWQMICTEDPIRLRTLVPTIPEHVERAIHTALSKQRSERFPRIADFIRSLGNLPQLGRVDAAVPGSAAAAKPAAPRPGAVAGAAAAPATPTNRDEHEPSEPTAVEPYLPGLTRPRLALLPGSGPGDRSVPEFVQPEGELQALRLASATPPDGTLLPVGEAAGPNPDLLVTAHYTAEQLIELSRLGSVREAEALVHAAQDVPTAPYRVGAAVRKDMDAEFDRTPLPVPRPLGAEPSARMGATLFNAAGALLAAADSALEQLSVTGVPGRAAPPSRSAGGASAALETAPEPKTALPLPELSDCGPVRRSIPPRPPAEAFAPRRSRPGLPAEDAAPVPARSAVSAPDAAPTSLPPPARPESAAALPLLPGPALLTLPGTSPPELGQPLRMNRPNLRRPLWRAVGAGSVVLGLLLAVLLGLRMARAKTALLRADHSSGAAQVLAGGQSASSLLSAAQVDTSSAVPPEQSPAQSVMKLSAESAGPTADESAELSWSRSPEPLLPAAERKRQPALAPAPLPLRRQPAQGLATPAVHGDPLTGEATGEPAAPEAPGLLSEQPEGSALQN